MKTDAKEELIDKKDNKEEEKKEVKKKELDTEGDTLSNGTSFSDNMEVQ